MYISQIHEFGQKAIPWNFANPYGLEDLSMLWIYNFSPGIYLYLPLREISKIWLYRFKDIATIKDYWPSLRSVPWNIGLRFLVPKTEVRYFTVQTEQAREVNKLFIIWLQHCIFKVILHLNNFDHFFGLFQQA